MKWVLLAQRDLANVFAHGLGVTANATEAYAWYSLVAAQGDHYSRTQQISLWKQMTLPQR
jgi:TPR repeat protein